MKGRPAVSLLSALATLAAASLLRAEPPEARKPLPTLTTIRQVRTLSLAESDLKYPVRVRAVVTYGCPRPYYLCFAQDSTNGIFVMMESDKDAPSTGEEVEIEGESRPGQFAPVILAKRVVRRGVAPLPAPLRLELQELRDGRYDSQWVEVQGVVRSAEMSEDGVLNLRVGSQHYAISARLPSPDPDLSPDKLLDAHVRLRGACGSMFDEQRRWLGIQIHVPNGKQIDLVRKAPSDPFSLTARTVASLLEFHSEGEAGHRVLVRGVATLQRPGQQSLFMQDETGSLYVRMSAHSRVRPGDVVEAVGFPATDGATPSLENAVVRVVGRAPVPKPLLLHESQGPDLSWDARWSSLTGILVGHVQRNSQHRLLVRADVGPGDAVYVFEVALSERIDGGSLHSIPVGAKIQMLGVCSVQPANGAPAGFRFYVDSPQDLTVLELPPWWSLAHTLAALGAMGGVVLLILAWVVLLRRRIRRQTTLIRERLEREANLEARYRDLFANATDVVFTTDVEGCITTINPAGERLVGYRCSELAGSKLSSIAAPESREAVERMVRASGPVNEELVVVSSGGEQQHWDVSAIPIRAAGLITGVEAIARDVTQRRRQEGEERQAQKMEAVGRLAGGVAHDFNNMLTVIIGGAEVLLPHADEDQCEVLSEIKKSGERAAALTQQLLTFSRKQISCRVAMDLNSVVLEMERMLSRLIGADVELGVDLEPDLQCIEADPRLIEQVVLNLALNARDAMPHGGRLTLSTANLREEGWVRLEVRDTGCGIDDSVREHLFEPFFTTKALGKGTGLGLASVYATVQQFHGRIAVESEPGAGTVFRIDFRAVAALPDPGRPKSEPPLGIAALGATILLVEDNDGVRRFIARVLRRSGCKVLEATNGDEAIDVHASSEEVDLVVSDIVMPKMNGRELSERLRKRQPDLPVLFMSGHTEDDVIRRGVLADDVHFLQKPFTPQRIIAKVDEILEPSAATAV